MATQTEIIYIESSLPAAVTISEYRRMRPKRASLWRRLRQLGQGPVTAFAPQVQ